MNEKEIETEKVNREKRKPVKITVNYNAGDGLKKDEIATYSDKAVDAMLTLAAAREGRMASLANQRIALATLNSAITGVVVSYVLENSIYFDNIMWLASLGFLILCGVFFLSASYNIACSELYYFRTIDQADYIMRQHYNIAAWRAKAEYQYKEQIKVLGFIGHRHQFFYAFYFNLALPIAAVIILVLHFSFGNALNGCRNQPTTTNEQQLSAAAGQTHTPCAPPAGPRS